MKWGLTVLPYWQQFQHSFSRVEVPVSAGALQAGDDAGQGGARVLNVAQEGVSWPVATGRNHAKTACRYPESGQAVCYAWATLAPHAGADLIFGISVDYWALLDLNQRRPPCEDGALPG